MEKQTTKAKPMYLSEQRLRKRGCDFILLVRPKTIGIENDVLFRRTGRLVLNRRIVYTDLGILFSDLAHKILFDSTIEVLYSAIL